MIDASIVIEYEQGLHAKPDANGVIVWRGKLEGRTVFVAAKLGEMAWATKREQAIRNLGDANVR